MSASPPRPGVDADAPPVEPPGESASAGRDRAAYWRANVRLVCVLLVVWFAVSYGCGILLRDVLDRVRLPGTGFRLGFWFAQQGSIYVFVALIFVYVVLMNRLERRFDVHED